MTSVKNARLATEPEWQSSTVEARPRVPWVLLVIGLVLPTAITWVYFVALAGHASGLQQLAYGLGKGGQFLLPVIAVGVWGDWKRGMLPAIQSLKGKLRRDWVLAIAFGFVVLLAMLGLYFAVLL
ncbi:MAG: hypothetical protein ACK5PZ_09820, partial [Pirellula sp.]